MILLSVGMEHQHRLQGNTGRKSVGMWGTTMYLLRVWVTILYCVRVTILYCVMNRGRKEGRSDGRQRGVILLLLVGVVRGNKPPRFVMEGNSGSEIVVRVREGEGHKGRMVVR